MTSVAEKTLKAGSAKRTKKLKNYVSSPFSEKTNAVDLNKTKSIGRFDFLKSSIEDFFRSDNSFILYYDKELPEILANKILADEPIIFSMAGESASGKSTAMDIFKQSLASNGVPFTMICADDYYLDTTKEIEEAGGMDNLFKKGFSFDVPERVDLDLIKEHFNSLRKGLTIFSPVYDFVTHASTPNVQEKVSAKFILHEGIYALNDKFRDCSDIRIYCETPSDIIKKRWYERVASRGTSKESWDGQFKNIKKAAKKYIHPTKDNANLIISGNCPADYMKRIFNGIILRLKLLAG